MRQDNSAPICAKELYSDISRGEGHGQLLFGTLGNRIRSKENTMLATFGLPCH